MEKKRHMIGKVVCAILLTAGFLFAIHVNLSEQESPYKTVLGEWTVCVDGQTYQTKDLGQLRLPSLKKGSRIEFWTSLPETGFSQTTLLAKFHRSVVHLYLGEEELYSYGKKYAGEGSLVGSGMIYVELPEDYSGRELKIVLEAQEKNAFSRLARVYLQETSKVYPGVLRENLLVLLVACFLLCFGWIGTVVFICMYRKKNHLETLFWISGFSVAMSVWLLANSPLIYIFIKDFQTANKWKYISLYLAPVFFLFFMYSLWREYRRRSLIWIMGIGFTAMDAGLILLNELNLAHYPVTLPLYQLIALVCGIAVAIIGLHWASVSGRRADQVFAYGILVFIICFIAELVRYMLDRYVLDSQLLDISWMPIGVLAFVIMMLLSFMIKMLDEAAVHMDHQALLRIAYTDALTNISNRARCEEEFRVYEESGQPLTIINIDLNWFKQVNDVYGHAAGDELLIRFASVLEQTFRDRGLVGRMGGDEFIVIMNYCPPEIVAHYMQELEQRVEQANAAAARDYRISFSYGFADNYENPERNIWKVYEKADRHMYEYKNEFKTKGGK